MPAVFYVLASAALLAAAEPTPERLTFCSYNLRNWLTMDRFDLHTQRALPATPKPESEKERVVKILAAIKPDILGVCEIGDSDDLAELQKRLKAAGVDLPHTELAHGGDETRRLALLSRLPIKARSSQLNLTYQIGEQTLPHQRGILDVTIAITPTLDIHFLGVHLKSKRDVPEADQAEMRRNEARLLRQHIDSLFTREPGAAILAYGDFNEHRNEPAIADIIGSPRTGETAMLDILLRDAEGEVWTHFWDEADTYSRLDYCFTSRLLRPHIDQRASFIYSARDFDKASDHRPLVLKISREPILKR
ncbi:MAG: endonuclease/exonuclease/phosphatase family protein [Prosthecobacter sp.]